MVALSRLAYFDRPSPARFADWAAVAVAVALPWSTSAVGIAIALWLVLLLPTLDPACIKRELASAAGGLPVLLWCLGAIGMMWADVSWHERFAGLDGFHRLLAIPLLLAQFRRSGNGIAVVLAFFISSTGVLIASYAIMIVFGYGWHRVYGIPVHDTIFQSTEFLISGFGALGYAVFTPSKQALLRTIGILALGALFLVNLGFATTSRSALVIAPLLLLLFGWRLSRWKGIFITVLLGVVAATAIWFASPMLRNRVLGSLSEGQEVRLDRPASINEHLAFLSESLTIVAAAPIAGHGTGSIAEEFRRVTAGKTGYAATTTVNPHNQTFAVAIQLGLIGAAVLWAMWVAHLFLFTGRSVIAWLGLVVVVENVLSSIVHSHLFDFNNGWLYVFAVGVLGGTIFNERDRLFLKAKPPETMHSG
jgi:O-antigen ligase